MKTIRQIADEIGVSKQAVYKRYKGKLHTVCAPYTHTEQGVLYLSEQSQEAGVVAVLQATIDTLQGQLEVKDRQIEELNARLAEVSAALLAAQQTAAAAQALHAGTIQQQLLTGEAGADQQGQEPEQKRGWFSKLFGK